MNGGSNGVRHGQVLTRHGSKVHSGSEVATFSEQEPLLLAGHFDELHIASGISVEVVAERG